MKRIIFVCFILLAANVSAQQEEFQPMGSFKAEIGLANNISNIAFRDLMQGLFNVTAGYQYTLPSSLSLGAGIRWNYFAVNEFKNNVDLAGGVHFGGAYGKIGIEKFYGQIGIDAGIRLGYNMLFSTTNKCSATGGLVTDENFFFEPVFNIGLLATENTSFYLTTSLAFHNLKFEPRHVCEPAFTAYDIDRLDRITTYFVVGFGYSYYFGKK
jgi:hypothetical protein